MRWTLVRLALVFLLMTGCVGVVAAGSQPDAATMPDAGLALDAGVGPGEDGGELGVGDAGANPLPAWLVGAPVNEWRAITGTAGPSMLGDYSGVALRVEPGLVEAFVGAAGGHASSANSLDNSVMTIDLDEGAPAWKTRRGPSDPTGFAPATMAIFPSDGAPAPRHLYEDVTWSPEAGAYIIGGRFLVGSYDTRATYFGFRPTTLSWSRLADRPLDGVTYSARDPVSGRFYSTQGFQYDPVTNVHSTWPLSGTAPVNRMSSAVDTRRRAIFNLSFGDGWSESTTPLVATSISLPGGAKTAITFAPSPGLTSLLGEVIDDWLCASVEYNPDLDVFYFYSGYRTKNLYVITPNDGPTWSIEMLAVAGSAPPDMYGTALNKLRYISPYKALVLFLPGADIHFLRTE